LLIEASVQSPKTILLLSSYHSSVHDTRVIGSVEEEHREPERGSAGIQATRVDLTLPMPLLNRYSNAAKLAYE
jgi:hypothetical protein